MQHLSSVSSCLPGTAGSRSLRAGDETRVHTKRSEPRFNAEGEATVQALHPLSVERHKVTIVNVSKNGFGILSPNSILPGTIVQIRIKDTVELGNVRYCSALGDDGFKIGVRMHDEV